MDTIVASCTAERVAAGDRVIGDFDTIEIEARSAVVFSVDAMAASQQAETVCIEGVTADDSACAVFYMDTVFAGYGRYTVAAQNVVEDLSLAAARYADTIAVSRDFGYAAKG